MNKDKQIRFINLNLTAEKPNKTQELDDIIAVLVETFTYEKDIFDDD